MILPLELLREIAYSRPGAYWVLVRCCKGIATMPLDVVKRFFTAFNGTAWRLPNGTLHTKDISTPTCVEISEIHKRSDWYMNGYRYRENNLPAIIVKINNKDGSCYNKRKYWIHNDKVYKSKHISYNSNDKVISYNDNKGQITKEAFDQLLIN